MKRPYRVYTACSQGLAIELSACLGVYQLLLHAGHTARLNELILSPDGDSERREITVKDTRITNWYHLLPI